MLVFRIKESDPLIDNRHGFKMSRDPFRFNVFLASINLHKVANYASWGGRGKSFFLNLHAELDKANSELLLNN